MPFSYKDFLLPILCLLVGFYFTNLYHQDQRKHREIIRLQAQEKRDEIVQAEADYWYDKMQVALSKPPTVITERVLVKATCPVRATDSAGVDDGAPAGTAELDRGLVQNLAKLGDEKEKIYAKCYNIVNAFQGIIQENSAGKKH